MYDLKKGRNIQRVDLAVVSVLFFAASDAYYYYISMANFLADYDQLQSD